jgi:hypothetical protein
MSAENESSIMSCANRQDPSLVPRAPLTSNWSITRNLFRPWALAFIALALSVALWGFSYKLSRYNPHPDASSRALLAKMWDKHQDLNQITAAAQAAAQLPQSELVFHSEFLLLRQAPNPEQYAFIALDDCQRIPALFRTVVPLRSPPFNMFAA